MQEPLTRLLRETLEQIAEQIEADLEKRYEQRHRQAQHTTLLAVCCSIISFVLAGSALTLSLLP